MIPVWIVFMKDSEPVFLSVHTSEKKAREAIARYVRSPYWGGKETDYVIKGNFLDYVQD